VLLVVGITGASGAIYGVRLLEELSRRKIETHLVVTSVAECIIKMEVELNIDLVKNLATVHHDIMDLQAPIASGTFKTDGMVVAPCSMKTLAAMAHGLSNNLLVRAADVTLKERRPLVIVPRESPLNIIHIKNMLLLAEAGAIIMPPAPAFYDAPKTVNDMINQVTGRILDAFHIEHNLSKRWSGLRKDKDI